MTMTKTRFELTRLVTLALLIMGARPVLAQSAEPAVAFGAKHGVALRTNGDVLTWGGNVFCQLGRATTSNLDGTPRMVMRNVKEIAVASSYTLALTVDGKTYAWGNGGALGTGDANAQCDGPVLVPSLSDKTVAHIAAGLLFSVAVTADGDLYCTGENDMGQCPAAPKGGRLHTFARVPLPELAGRAGDVRAGDAHVLIRTADRRLYAIGRGWEGQLGGVTLQNGAGYVPGMDDVVSFAAGMRHSVAVRRDGTAWAWGHDGQSQLCDGATADRSVPAKIASLPSGATIAQVAAGGHSTLLRANDGTIYACGDNRFGAFGAGKSPVVPRPIVIAPRTKAPVLTTGRASAFSVDGCTVLMAGDNDDLVVSASGTGQISFALRANLSLCAPPTAVSLPSVVTIAPRGGAAGCWTPRVQENGATNPKWAGLREAILSIESVIRRSAAFMAAPEPVRYRSRISIGPQDDSGAGVFVKAAAERKMDGTRVWTGECDVIPQIDRIGGEIATVGVLVNVDARGLFIGPAGEAPKLTGRVGPYPEYNGWVVITKDGRLPWVPETLQDKLDAEGTRRKDALAQGVRAAASGRSDDVALKATLDGRVKAFEVYRASFSPAELRAAAVWGDATGEGERRLQTQIAALQDLPADEQRQADAWDAEARALGREARVQALTNGNPAAAEKLRAQANDLSLKVRDLRQAHAARVSLLIDDMRAQYQLTNLRPGTAEKAISVKRDASLPDATTPNRVQIILVSITLGRNLTDPGRLAWLQQIKDSVDFAALAGLLK